MAERHEWQRITIDRITAAEQPLNAGQLFAEVMHLIPLHHGGRYANKGISRAGVSLPRERDLTATELRWSAFRNFLLRQTLTFDPPVSRASPLTMSNRLSPVPRNCEVCGKPYLGAKEAGSHRACILSQPPARRSRPEALPENVVELRRARSTPW